MRAAVAAGQRLRLARALCALAFVPAAAGRAAASPAAIVFASETCDLGSIVQGERPACEFTFTNAGGEDLVVQGIEPSCGCTSALLVAPLVRPGGRGAIRVVFDSDSFAGEVVKEIEVHSNDATRASLTLRVKALVEPEIDFEPRAVSLDDARPGDSQLQVVMITNRRAEPVRILETSAAPGSWTCSLPSWTDPARPLVVESWDRVRLEVRFTGPPVVAMPISGECLLQIEGPHKRHFRLKLLALPAPGP